MSADQILPPEQPHEPQESKSLAALFPLWLWCLPFVVFGVSAPLWLHTWEPGMFMDINTLCAPVAAQVWTGLSLLGNGWAVLGVTAPLLVHSPRLMWAWLCAAPFAIVFARTGKALLESPRPAAVVDNSQMRVVGELLHNVSMPSGHTTTAFAVLSAIYFALDAKQRRRHWWLLALAGGAGLSRIAVGAHWPGDVAVGASLGLLCGLLGNVLLPRIPAYHFQSQAWSLRLIAMLMAVAVFHLVTEELDFAENQLLQWGIAAVATAYLLAFAMRSAKALRAS
jgi:membrane-associated phospholipid phosphatase